MTFQIRQNDRLPRIIKKITATFPKDYPNEKRIVYNSGDVVNMYLENYETGWVTRPAKVLKVINGGKEILVQVDLLPEDVAFERFDDLYFRNETMQISMPTTSNYKLQVIASAHEYEPPDPDFPDGTLSYNDDAMLFLGDAITYNP